MASKQIDYSRLVEAALRRVVHDALRLVEQEGLPGGHHLYITFASGAPGVRLSDALAARYPNEMTIVLQHEFWGLEVTDAGFAVTLSFNSTPERIDEPFDAITVFADPSVEFGLQFQPRGMAPDAGAGAEAAAPAGPERAAEVTALPQPEPAPKPVDGGADVVPLDQFRRK